MVLNSISLKSVLFFFFPHSNLHVTTFIMIAVFLSFELLHIYHIVWYLTTSLLKLLLELCCIGSPLYWLDVLHAGIATYPHTEFWSLVLFEVCYWVNNRAHYRETTATDLARLLDLLALAQGGCPPSAAICNSNCKSQIQSETSKF